MSAPTTTMSVTQALAELKLLRKRLDKQRDATFVTVKTKTRDVDVEEFSRHARSAYQSFQDLLLRYNKVKSAIVVSNATASVNVAGKDYSIAEAVERKRSIDLEKALLKQMQTQWKEVTNEIMVHQRVQQERLDKMILQEVGKDSKTSVEVINALTDMFLRNNKAELIDPLGLEKRITEFSKDIEEFETNIDWVLSESNGRITITI